MTLVTIDVGTFTSNGMSFATSTPSTITMKSRFELSCAIAARGMESFHTPSVGKFSILVKPDHSRRDDIRVVGKRAASADDVAFACVLVTATRNSFAVPKTAVATSNGRVISGSMRMEILPTSRTTGKTSKGNNGRDRNATDHTSSKASMSGDSLFVATATDGVAICRRRTFLLACGVCALISLHVFSGIGLPSFGKFRSRRMRLPGSEE